MKQLSSLFILTISLVGCGKSGPPIAPVSGTVTLDGSPLTEGVVSFVSATGYVSSAPLGPDGNYRLVSQYGDGIPFGEYRVTVLPKAQDPGMMASPPPRSLPTHDLPDNYQYPDRSGLSATVDGSSPEFSFPLSLSRKQRAVTR